MAAACSARLILDKILRKLPYLAWMKLFLCVGFQIVRVLTVSL